MPIFGPHGPRAASSPTSLLGVTLRHCHDFFMPQIAQKAPQKNTPTAQPHMMSKRVKSTRRSPEKNSPTKPRWAPAQHRVQKGTATTHAYQIQVSLGPT